VPSTDPFSRRQPPWIGRVAQSCFPEGLAGAVVEADAVLLAGPHGVGPHLPRPLHREEGPAGAAPAVNQSLEAGALCGIELVVGTQRPEHVPAQLFHSRQSLVLGWL